MTINENILQFNEVCNSNILILINEINKCICLSFFYGRETGAVDLSDGIIHENVSLLSYLEHLWVYIYPQDYNTTHIYGLPFPFI